MSPQVPVCPQGRRASQSGLHLERGEGSTYSQGRKGEGRGTQSGLHLGLGGRAGGVTQSGLHLGKDGVPQSGLQLGTGSPVKPAARWGEGRESTVCHVRGYPLPPLPPSQDTGVLDYAAGSTPLAVTQKDLFYLFLLNFNQISILGKTGTISFESTKPFTHTVNLFSDFWHESLVAIVFNLTGCTQRKTNDLVSDTSRLFHANKSK